MIVNNELERCGRKRSWPNLRYHPGICLEGLRKDTETLSQYSRSPGRDLNPRPPEYEAGVLTTRPQRSVALPTQIFFIIILSLYAFNFLQHWNT
jgi:hypothetical protein